MARGSHTKLTVISNVVRALILALQAKEASAASAAVTSKTNMEEITSQQSKQQGAQRPSVGSYVSTFSQFKQLELASQLEVELPADPWETEFSQGLNSPLISSSTFNRHLPSSAELLAPDNYSQLMLDRRQSTTGFELRNSQSSRPAEDYLYNPRNHPREDPKTGPANSRSQAMAPDDSSRRPRSSSKAPWKAALCGPEVPNAEAADANDQAAGADLRGKADPHRLGGKPCKTRGFLKPNSEKDFRRMESYCHMMSAKVSPSLFHSSAYITCICLL